MNTTISKSAYMQYLRHPALMWLSKREKHRLPPTDPNLQAMFDAGHEFESYAEQLFPGATRIGFDIRNFSTYRTMPSRTREVLDSGVSIILQGRLETGGITCIFDVLTRVEGNTFDLIEIKSSTRAKPEHAYDLAFQTVLLEDSGLTIRNISVIHADKKYVREGKIDPTGITATTNITEEVRELIELTRQQIKDAHAVLAGTTCPDLSPRHTNRAGVKSTNWAQDYLAVYHHLHPDLDSYSIYHLSYPTPEQIGELEDAGIKLIKDIPLDLAVRDKQRVQIETTLSGEPIIDSTQITEFLNTFTYPLYFLDYETFSHVIPQFPGGSPYADYPFQYSLHILDSPGSELRHTEYLHQGQDNPMPGLITQLQKDIGGSGTVLTWNMSYEKGCNDRMASCYLEHAEFLAGLNARIDDLMTPFSKMWCFYRDFMGSASVKKVMPVLAPELSYQDLSVGDGLLARRLWTETVMGGKNQDKREQVISDLSLYCTLDTYAMVRILEELYKTK